MGTDDSKRRPPLPTQPGLGSPRVPAVDERRDSMFAFNAEDRELLENVLKSAKAAIDQSRAAAEREARERTTLEGKLTARVGDLESEVADLTKAVNEFRGVSGDLRGLRGDISTLNANVMQSMATDAAHERRFGELKLQVEMIGANAGGAAGKSSGARMGAIVSGVISGIGGIVWLLSYLASIQNGSPPPKPPSEMPKAAPAVRWP